MIDVSNKVNCTGCTACAMSCPKKCITMQADAEGFLYPSVNVEKCIDCGVCDKVCPILKVQTVKNTPVAYAARSCNEIIRENSSSGGIFSEIAKYILERNGVVFGAAFNEALQVEHICIDNQKELYRLRGSKYVQSDLLNSFEKAKCYLEAGRQVMFSGTPCQIYGLYAYLRKPYENLITQDLICHGVPSAGVWRAYLQDQEQKAQSTTRNASFRNKRIGWRQFSLHLQFQNQSQYSCVQSDDPYMRLFLNNISLRPSCYHCMFKTKHRSSDITLADFWGIEKVLPEMDDDKGTSLVILNSDKGKALFEEIKSHICCKEVDFETAISFNSAMRQSVPLHSGRQVFFTKLQDNTFSNAAKPFLRVSPIKHVKRIIKILLKKLG